MSIGANIKKLRTDAGLSQEKLGELIGKTRSAISYYESDTIIPRMGVIEELASVFDVPKSVIIGEGHIGSTFVPVPLYGSVAAGRPIEMIEVDDMKEAPARFVDADPDCYLVRVRGNSMNHRIQDSDFALVSPRYTEPNDRDMFLVTVNGDDATIKMVRVLENGVELLPDSYDPTFRPRVLDFGEESTPPFRVLGKVVWWCKEF